MEPKTLTREEIALTILGGMAGFQRLSLGNAGALDSFSYTEAEENQLSEKEGHRVCSAAFQLADLFIQERDKA